jgi:hypothetical protein
MKDSHFSHIVVFRIQNGKHAHIWKSGLLLAVRGELPPFPVRDVPESGLPGKLYSEVDWVSYGHLEFLRHESLKQQTSLHIQSKPFSYTWSVVQPVASSLIRPQYVTYIQTSQLEDSIAFIKDITVRQRLTSNPSQECIRNAMIYYIYCTGRYNWICKCVNVMEAYPCEKKIYIWHLL